MATIETFIDIDAPSNLIWHILVDFGSYRRWNPLITRVSGKLGTGSLLDVTLSCPDGRTLLIRPLVVHLREGREMQWSEGWVSRSMFGSLQRFSLETLGDGRVRFHHSEVVHGMLAPLLRRRREVRTVEVFDSMNRALKVRAERNRDARASQPSP